MENKKEKFGRASATVFALFLCFAIFFGGYAGGRKDGKAKALSDIRDYSEINLIKKAGTADFSPFWKVWDVINQKYVGATTTDQDKVWGAIEGLASSLEDPYTIFMPPVEAGKFEEELSGSFDGIGIEIAMKDEILTVVAPLKGTPAYKAGIKSGDKIVGINGTPTTGMRVDQAVKLIRGKKGTEVKLTILREGKGSPIEISVVRDSISVPTAETYSSNPEIAKKEVEARKDGIFVIHFYNFYNDSVSKFRNALREFVSSGSKKLIIDLRGNPGGYLESAVSISGWFLPSGAVVVRQDSGGRGPELILRSPGPGVFGDVPLAVLVDKGSASASEILAGALSEHGKAKLVGEKTFGKGTVQEVVPVADGATLKITIARWLTPNGKSIAPDGITPDIEIKLTDEDIKNQRDSQFERAVEYLRTGK